MPGVEGLKAVVTGGGRGIGAAIAAALTGAGAHVTVLGRTEAMLVARVKKGEAAAYFLADVCDEGSFSPLMRRIAAEQTVDILVNNAGAVSSAAFLRTAPAEFRAMLDVNLIGPVIAMREVLPGMTERKFGRIINIASTAALKGYPYVSAYVAAKHALLGLTRALALETAKSGVTVNAVCPGYTDTDLIAESVDKIVSKTHRTAAEVRAELAASNPMGRLVTPAEVADAVVCLARRESGAISGAAVAVSGGEA